MEDNEKRKFYVVYLTTNDNSYYRDFSMGPKIVCKLYGYAELIGFLIERKIKFDADAAKKIIDTVVNLGIFDASEKYFVIFLAKEC